MEKIDWILNLENKGVVSNLAFFLPRILEGEYGLEHKFYYENGVMVHYAASNLVGKAFVNH